MYVIATPEKKIKKIMKRGNVFGILDGEGKVVHTIYGTQMVGRASEKVSRKWKVKGSVDL